MHIRSRYLLSLLLTIPLAAGAQQVIRHPLPNHSTFPISAAVEVPAGKTMGHLE